ncbi:hypothetical protein AMJ87_10425 [candidate division WOR_3 bacterium SM23_60]|uniref:Polymer-forming cytoskeletal protein n=1 Tax=candidate division WOR_3 bacterium SM23_60 TaxID=1703780 RepID=A0A0S8GCD1_UNCW3|nr:MAG: hypothetical protein AMJ87_10425 [candidate division WOR_3 bacterium SM23_60]
MQVLIAILLAISSSVLAANTSREYVGQMPEVVVTAPRYEYEDEAWAGLMPETVTTAPRYEYEDAAWSGLMPETVTTAPRHHSEQVPNVIMADIFSDIRYAIAEMRKNTRTNDQANMYYECVEVVHIPAQEFSIRQMEFIPAGLTMSGDYHLPETDTINEDMTVSGGNAEIDGVIDGDLAVMGGMVDVNGAITGDIAVFGGNLAITGNIHGDAAVFGGNVTNQGNIRGDLAVIGGTVFLDSGSVIAGDILMVGGTVDRDDYAEVLGNIESIEIEALEEVLPRISRVFRFPHRLPGYRLFPRLAFLGMLVVLYVFNLLIIAIFPHAIAKVSDRVKLNVWAALGLGLAIEILFVPILILLTISIIGIPLAILLPMALLIGILFGFSALSLVIGERISKGFGWNVTNSIGLFSLGWITIMLIPLVVGLIGPPIAALGWIIVYVAMTIAAGGVLFAFIKRNGTAASK